MADFGDIGAIGQGLTAVGGQVNNLANFIQQSRHQQALERNAQEQLAMSNERLGMEKDRAEREKRSFAFEMGEKEKKKAEGKMLFDATSAFPEIFSDPEAAKLHVDEAKKAGFRVEQVGNRVFTERNVMPHFAELYNLQSAVQKNRVDFLTKNVELSKMRLVSQLNATDEEIQKLQEKGGKADPQKIQELTEKKNALEQRVSKILMFEPEILKAIAIQKAKNEAGSDEYKSIGAGGLLNTRTGEVTPPIKEGTSPSYQDVGITDKGLTVSYDPKKAQRVVTLEDGSIVPYNQSSHGKVRPKTEQQGLTLTVGAQKALGERFGITGELPGLGLGRAATEARAAIINKWAEQLNQSGQTGADQAQIQAAYKASRNELSRLQSQRGSVMAFAKTADLNLKLAGELSEKVGRSGIPVLNRWLLAGKRSLQGDTDVVRFDAAVRTAINEYARVTTTVTGGGITSDTARKEVESMLNSAQTPQQVQAVLKTLEQEIENRRTGYDEQITSIKDSITNMANPTKKEPEMGKKVGRFTIKEIK